METTTQKISRAAKMPVAVGSFTYDPAATINPDIFRALFENDLTFRLTWGNKRTDFKDQSQSSYDLALANIFYEASVSDQETVNALVHHRRLRNQAPKPDPQYYYRRTLSMARAKTTHATDTTQVGELQTALAELVTGKLSAESTLDQAERVAKPVVAAVVEKPPTSAPVAKIAKSKDQWLAEFNHNLDLHIDGRPVLVARNVWVRGTKPSWRMELANEEKEIITLTDASQWLTYEGMRAAVVAQVNGTIVIPNRKNEWVKFIVPQFQGSLVAETADEENDIRGDTREILRIYFRGRGIVPLESIWTDNNNLYLPTIYKGRVAVYAKDICDAFARASTDKLEKHVVISGLSAIKATRDKINGPNGQSQSRYLLPEEWNPENLAKTEARARINVPVPEDE
jgi:hypothetical protein